MVVEFMLMEKELKPVRYCLDVWRMAPMFGDWREYSEVVVDVRIYPIHNIVRMSE